MHKHCLIYTFCHSKNPVPIHLYVLIACGMGLEPLGVKSCKMYMYFLPKTTRDWNVLLSENVNLHRLQQTDTIESFKACFKREYLRSPN